MNLPHSEQIPVDRTAGLVFAFPGCFVELQKECAFTILFLRRTWCEWIDAILSVSTGNWQCQKQEQIGWTVSAKCSAGE